MGKAKKSKGISDAVHAKKGATAAKWNPFSPAAVALKAKKTNPFEVHVNREKFNILGRTCKHDKGLPGVSRAKAVKKRQETLGKEYNTKHKTNQFRDRRIGKYGEVTDEVINARFIAEKIYQMKQGKASRFNLNDDEVLTHRGQTLAEIEQFRDERSDDDDDEHDNLDANFTEAAHFGGDSNPQEKDRQTAIDDMIMEQKRRKVEIAKEKDEVHQLTEKLDTNYKTLLGVMGKMSKDEMKAKPPTDDYDKIMREMIFEPRGVVTDKLLSEEDQAKKEKQRLEQLEKERLQRMLAEGEENDDKARPKHRSADDLDDGYFAQAEEMEESTLAYNLDGELGTRFNTENEDASSSNAEEEDEEESGEEEEINEEKNEATEKECDENGTEDDDDSVEEDDEDEEDNFSDLKMSDSESVADAESLQVKNQTKKPELKKKQADKKNHEILEEDIPFTLEMPQTYKDFRNLIVKHTPDKQSIVIERLIKCNHPKLDAVNRESVVKLFAFLLQYINELFADVTEENVTTCFQTLDRLSPHLYDLMHLNSERMAITLLNVIKEKYAEYRKNPKQYPLLDTVIFLKIVSNLFTTSDFRHPVVTPCYIFIQHVLSKARIRSRQDIAIGLFLVTIALEYAELSKRFLPAAFNFLLGSIFLSIPKCSVEVFKILPPFQNTGTMSTILTVDANTENIPETEQLMLSEDLITTTLTTDFKVRALNTTLKLITDAITLVGENKGSNYLAEPLLEMISRLPLNSYPKFVQTNYETTEEALKKIAAKKLTKLVPPEKKPKALRLLEPRFEAVYDDKRRPKVSKAKEEKLKLIHKLKRETKGAVREIRKDTEFLQKMRIKQQIKSDMERKEKVKRIFSEAAMQQGELNELQRAKKKKKF